MRAPMTTDLEQTIAALVAAHGWPKVRRHLEKILPKAKWNVWQSVYNRAEQAAAKQQQRKATK